jgi:hypothetical protein
MIFAASQWVQLVAKHSMMAAMIMKICTAQSMGLRPNRSSGQFPTRRMTTKDPA